MGRSGPDVKGATKDRACARGVVWLDASWIRWLLLLAGPAVSVEIARAEPEQNRTMIATRSCRTVASTSMIKVNSTRVRLRSHEQKNILANKCFIAWRWVGSVRSCTHPQ